MGNWTALHTLALLAIGALAYYLFFSGSSSKNSAENEEERIRVIGEKFNAIDSKKMLRMTVEEIASATDSTSRGVIARLSRHKLKCKDFDGSISIEERAEKKEIEKNIGKLMPQIICPHCQTKGQVHKKLGVERRENTTDTTNLTAAILSGTKTTVRKVTQLHCTNCETAWDI
jgi:hypothetical protein